MRFHTTGHIAVEPLVLRLSSDVNGNIFLTFRYM